MSSFVCVDGFQSAANVTYINKVQEVIERSPLECFKNAR
jgi:hypothetical protein